MDENLLTVVDENGNEVLCEILFTFDSDEYEKSYVFYVPVETKDDDEEVEVQCSSYEPLEDGSIGELHEIEDDDEWSMVEEVFETYLNSMEDEDFDDEDDDCCCGHHHDDDEDDEDCCCHHKHER